MDICHLVLIIIHLMNANQVSVYFAFVSLIIIINTNFPTSQKYCFNEKQILLQCLLLFLSSKLVHHPFFILDKLILYKYNSMRQNQRDLALRVLEQQLVAKSASPAGSNELLEQTLCVQQRGALGQGSRHGATGQSVNRKENVNRLHVTCYLKNASRNVQQKQASHKQFYSIILTYNIYTMIQR